MPARSRPVLEAFSDPAVVAFLQTQRHHLESDRRREEERVAAREQLGHFSIPADAISETCDYCLVCSLGPTKLIRRWTELWIQMGRALMQSELLDELDAAEYHALEAACEPWAVRVVSSLCRAATEGRDRLEVVASAIIGSLADNEKSAEKQFSELRSACWKLFEYLKHQVPGTEAIWIGSAPARQFDLEQCLSPVDVIEWHLPGKRKDLDRLAAKSPVTIRNIAMHLLKERHRLSNVEICDRWLARGWPGLVGARHKKQAAKDVPTFAKRGAKAFGELVAIFAAQPRL